jgi:hypothetical protein
MMTLQKLTSIDLFYFIICEDPHSLKWDLVEGTVTYGFTLHLKIRDHTT